MDLQADILLVCALDSREHICYGLGEGEMSMFKTKFCWLPVRLVRHIQPVGLNGPTLEFIGWVWWQRANLTMNLNHGWIAILDSKPLKPRCKKCGQVLPE